MHCVLYLCIPQSLSGGVLGKFLQWLPTGLNLSKRPASYAPLNHPRTGTQAHTYVGACWIYAAFKPSKLCVYHPQKLRMPK